MDEDSRLGSGEKKKKKKEKEREKKLTPKETNTDPNSFIYSDVFMTLSIYFVLVKIFLISFYKNKFLL